MDLVDAASEAYKQVALQTGEFGARAAVHLAVRVTGGGASALVSAVRVLHDAATRALHERQTTGKIPVRDFGRTVTGDRAVVGIDERALARELASTLKRSGVTFAVEHGPGGTRTFHVKGNDMKVVQHALSVARESVDRRIARNQTRRRNAEQIAKRVMELVSQRTQKGPRSYGEKSPERSSGTR